MKQRIMTALVAIAALLIVLFVVPETVAQFVILAVILAGAWEWSAFLGFSGSGGRLGYVAAIAALLGAATFLPVDPEIVLMISMVWWLLAMAWTAFFPTPIPAAIRWTGGALVLVPLFVALMMLYSTSPATLLFALLIVWAADTGAYFSGKTLGRVKLAPKISPGKTWEGAIGGLVAVVLLILVRSFWFDTNLRVFVPFCLAVACLSIVGDLTVSMFKRSSGLKDSGSLFPGHGGVLDRIDSVAAAVPLYALGITWAGIQ